MSSSSGSDEIPPPQFLFTCRKCPKKEFREEEKDAHREFHKKMKLAKNRKTRRRSASPSPSAITTGSLFSVKNPQGKRAAKDKEAPSTSKSSKRTPEQRTAAATKDHTDKSSKNKRVLLHGG